MTSRSTIFIQTTLLTVLGIILLLLILRFVDFHSALAGLFQQLTLAKIFFLLFLSLLSYFIGALRWSLVLKAQTGTFPVPFWKSFLIILAGSPISYAVPSLGLSGQLGRIYFASRVGLAKELAITSFSLEYLIRNLVNNLAIIAGLLFFAVRGLTLPQPYFTIYLIFFLLLLLGIGYFFFFKTTSRKFQNFRKQIKEGFSKRPAWLGAAILTSLGAVLFTVIQIFLVAFLLKIPLTFYQAILVSMARAISGGLPFPFKLGASEGGTVLSFGLLGLSLEQGLTLALTIRLQDFLTVFVGVGVLISILIFPQKKYI
jgi:uncharacterized membrane protein YbhN (UPF0104 family)